MPAVPKKKPSDARRHQRHSDWRRRQAAQAPNTVVCDHCQQPKLSHRVCANCGYYQGKQIIEPKTKVRKVKA